MELPDEILKLLREIRDNQRELLVLEQQRKERSERRYRDWKEAEEQHQKKIESYHAKWDEDQSLWKKANDVYLRSHEDWVRRNKTAGKLALIFVAVFLVVLGIGGALAVLGWIN